MYTISTIHEELFTAGPLGQVTGQQLVDNCPEKTIQLSVSTIAQKEQFEFYKVDRSIDRSLDKSVDRWIDR